MSASDQEIFGFLKTSIDAHTMGLRAASALLADCGYEAFMPPAHVERAAGALNLESSQETVVEWIVEHGITMLGFSYRLDPDDAVQIFGRLMHLLRKRRLYGNDGAQIRHVHFAGLAPACERIEREYGGAVAVFRGGESAEESLATMGVPKSRIPKRITEGCEYDKYLEHFGRALVDLGAHERLQPPARNAYAEFGTARDSLELRLRHNYAGGFLPLTRAHSGPYSPEMTREQCLELYNQWCRELAAGGWLDVLSVGSSQLSQSNFGGDWAGLPNGGGVPVNSEDEYRAIWLAARPMLVRTYSGTRDVRKLADVYERTINIAWHALSLWWFDELDGRGPNALYDNLVEHFDAMRYAAICGTPVETNVSHHFAFRGCDDVTYIMAAYLAARSAKSCGVRTFVLQNMLNTPRSTWGIQDLAKSRAMLALVKGLEDDGFRVILQTRAGLDYFKPDLEVAKRQLASVSAMMDDIEPLSESSPQIVHVVSYSEALWLATPEILNDSVRITRAAMAEYRAAKKRGEGFAPLEAMVASRSERLERDARAVIAVLEEHIPALYTPEGLYLAFAGGWLPVPDLWSYSDEFAYACSWESRLADGGMALSSKNVLLTLDARINKCVRHVDDAKYLLKHKYGISVEPKVASPK